MNRMAVACGLAVAGLTVAAFVNHVQSAPLPGAEAPPPRSEVPPLPENPVAFLADVEAAAPAAAGREPAPATRVPVPTVDYKALQARIEREIVTPLRKRFLDRKNFSRVRLPEPDLSLHLRAPTRRERRGPTPTHVEFEIEQASGRLSRGSRSRVMVYGRVETATGRIEMALPASRSKATKHPWEPASKTLARLGVETP